MRILFNSRIFILNLKLLLTSRIYPRDIGEGVMDGDVNGSGLAIGELLRRDDGYLLVHYSIYFVCLKFSITQN